MRLPAEPARIAVLRALPGLGDLLCAIPALRSLRRAYPGSEVTFLGLPGSEWFVDRCPELLDRLMPVSYWPGIPEADGSPDGAPHLLRTARRRHFDVAIQLHGTGYATNELVQQLGATVTAGHHPLEGPIPDARTYRPWPSTGHEIDRLLDLMVWLGCPPTEPVIDIVDRPAEQAQASTLIGSARCQPYICVHPGASRPDRRWAPDAFAEVVRALLASGLHVVITGTETERALAQHVEQSATQPAMKGAGRVIIAAGRTSIGVLSALLRGAELLVANDTGVVHLAVAVHTPTAVVITTSDETRWAPRDRSRNRVVVATSREAGRHDPSPARVLAAALELLAKRRAGAMRR